jgi:TDG/mug DNA glycosylase family protein
VGTTESWRIVPDGGGPERVTDVLVGAGFTVESLRAGRGAVRVTVTRERTLPDTVGAGLRLLVSGLNPSLYAADAGIGFARPGNRFWPAALAAGVVAVDRDPDAALAAGIGLTDVVKRATPRADELGAAEYRSGMARLARTVAWLEPAVVCFVGLAGWRAAVDRCAVAGPQPEGLGGRPVYVMPSTSGLNAHASLDELAEHFRRAFALALGATA